MNAKLSMIKMIIVQFVNKDGRKIKMTNQYNVMIAKCGYTKIVMRYSFMIHIDLNNIAKIQNSLIDVPIVEDY